MKSLKNFLRSINIFGITYSFRYKDKEKYQTVSGGFFLILFIILVLVFGIYNFIPFINRKNYAIVYYTMHLAASEEVNLFASNSNFAVGLTCDYSKNEKSKIEDLLDLKAKYILYVKKEDGSHDKKGTDLEIHTCNYADFYNQFDDQVDYLGLSSRFKCLAEKKNTVQGFFADQIFSYFEFTLSTKNDSILNTVENFLYNNDCKFNIIFTDIIIDLDDYKTPITQFLNDDLFIQLNPTLFIKRNVYFMNQYFTNDDSLIFNFGDDDEKEIKTLYSRYEEYALYMGFDRIINKPYNYANFAKKYFRADLKRTIIQRKYEKLMEFYADASSILIGIYEVLCIVFNYIDYFYAYHTLAKHLFFFKEMEPSTSFNIFQKRNQIKDIISLIENNEKTIGELKPNISLNISDQNKEKDKKKDIENDKNQSGIQIYINKNDKLIDNPSNNEKNYKISEEEKNNNKILMMNNSSNPNRQKINKYNNNPEGNSNIDSKSQLQQKKIPHLQDNIEQSNNIKLIYNERYGFGLNNSNNKDNELSSSFSSSSSAPEKPKKKKLEKISNSFNVFEILITQFFGCCKSQNMTIKNIVNENANKIIYNKLNIITYIRNMILFDIINRTILDDNKKEIINFLCRPIISVNGNEKQEFHKFYKKYKERDFEKFINNLEGLLNKPEKSNKENKLISTSNKHLKAFV